jgi:hypothetical protein
MTMKQVRYDGERAWDKVGRIPAFANIMTALRQPTAPKRSQSGATAFSGVQKGMDLRGNSEQRRRDRKTGLGIGAAIALGVAVGLLLVGCGGGGSGPEDAIRQLSQVDYGKPYLGMSKDEVLRCAGQPRSRIPAGQTTETLVYHYTGGGPVPGEKKEKATCTASLTFEKGSLVRVSYAHMDVRSPYAWQSEDDPKKAEQMRREGTPTCVFSLPRCPRT